MAVPKTLVWSRDPHTEAKHLIIRGYGHAWWPILLSANQQVTYAEGFCGPGEYSGGEDGSPVVALRSLLEHEQEVPLAGRTVNVVLVDDHGGRLSNCIDAIQDRVGPLPPQLHVHASAGKCHISLTGALTAADAWGHPILAVLDPFSANVPIDVIERIGTNRSSEVIVSFMSDWFTRWASDENQEQGDRQFGNTEWRNVRDVPSDRKKLWLVDLYRQRLHEVGFRYTLLFELVDEGGHAYFLVFASNSRLGLQKMKEAMWRVDKVSGIKFRDPRDPSQLSFDVGNTPDLTPLRNLIVERLTAVESMTVGELRAWALEETAFLPTHAGKVLTQLRAAGQLEPTSGRLTAPTSVRLVGSPTTRTTPQPTQASLF